MRQGKSSAAFFLAKHIMIKKSIVYNTYDEKGGPWIFFSLIKNWRNIAYFLVG